MRQEHAVVALADEIYVIGGYTPNATATVEAYDPVARSWRAVRDFPMVLNHANAAVVGDELYVTGFYVGSSMSNTSRQVFVYDPAMNEWTERTPMPDGTERATGCVAALGDTIYVFGGARGSTVSDASAYDTVLDEWQALPALPEPREHCAAGAIDGILYIAAGRSGGISGFRPATLAFDPTAMSYSMKAPITDPSRRRGERRLERPTLRVRRRRKRCAGLERCVPDGRSVRPAHERLGGAASAHGPAPRLRRRNARRSHLPSRRRNERKASGPVNEHSVYIPVL